ncbi:Putative xylose repressor [Actinoplanes sp. SE50]|uniref:ROK family transcriptional regulator n=1 Tax=unclassified Actinoplanes TaxID=2626549 RepID=UPI00023EC793|nr:MULTISPECIES: ROK family transcriptional regulator [unclassified Actinoplanes]AEV83677.1 Putative xylose repressor [Actinoplanes sp. SE50/110]ATO82179.1 Putative xylose repressor [Actinoplanes sp. SE50]SLL99586.1 ROK family protein [Actinoplanes sp. SE50/110]
MRRTGTNLPKVGQYNRAVVLDQIQLADGISRVEIAELTGLTPQTVSGIVRRLIGEGIVREDGATVSNGGKPRTLLRVNAAAGLAVGVHFDPSQLSCVVADLLGRPLVQRQQPIRPGAGPTEVVAAVAGLVTDVLAAAGVPRDRVLGLGLATPGPIDQSLGALVGPPQLLGWTRVPLKDMLAAATGLPVTLDNDATAAAIGECWAGAGRGVADFAYFFFGAGVGGGLILGQQVYRGGSMNAAEFGHQTVLPGGPPCYCGNRGCLESLISPGALVARSGLTDYDTLRQAALDGDRAAVDVVEAAAEHLATAVVNVANILDVDLFVLGGHGLRHLESRFRDAAAKALETRPLARSIRTVRVEVSPLGADAAVVGAAALVLHTTYAPQVSELLSL